MENNNRQPIPYEIPGGSGGGSEYHFRPSRNYLLFADKHMNIHEPRPDWWEEGNRRLQMEDKKRGEK